MKAIFGLGNFGDKYAYTYHNMGFLVAECLADRLGLKFKKRECDALVAKGVYNGEEILIAKPLTFMNLSGLCVKGVMKKYALKESDIIVVFDDIDLDKGAIRKRLSGSGGTHNGMRNIIAQIGTTEFARVRVGIGRPEHGENLADYVLSDVNKAHRQIMSDAIESAADAVLDLLNGN